jgi:NAD(P)-dependent dehydrogenase (short-subunit alcohol dehydrogenase family)
MELRLDGKVALVTGGSRGIGKAIALRAARDGANIVIAAKTTEAHPKLPGTIHSAAEEIEAAGGKALALQVDVRDENAIAAAVAKTAQTFGGIDILVNNAAANPYMGPLTGLDAGRAEKTHRVNQWGPVLWTQLAVKHGMGEGGSIVNIASTGGLGVTPGIAYYSSTKAALINLTKQLAAELAPKIRVNALAPGLVKTDFARALWEKNEAAIAKTMPLQRLGEPEDIAAAALFVVSNAASWMTGQTIVIDGGAQLNRAG